MCHHRSAYYIQADIDMSETPARFFGKMESVLRIVKEGRFNWDELGKDIIELEFLYHYYFPNTLE